MSKDESNVSPERSPGHTGPRSLTEERLPAQKAPKPPKPRKVEKRQRGRKG